MKKREVWPRMTIVLIIIYLAVPLLATILYSVVITWDGVNINGFVPRYYIELFSSMKFPTILLNTLLISVISALICLVILLFAMYVVVVHFPRLDKYVHILCLMPYTVQGIILSTSLLTVYSGIGGILSDRIFLLACAYCILALPYMYQSIRNNLNAIPVTCYLENAEILGAGKLRGFFAVIVPNLLSGMATSFLLSVGVLFNDFAIINILAGSYLTTVQMYMQNNGWRSGHLTSAIVIASFAITTLLTVFVLALKSRAQKEKNI